MRPLVIQLCGLAALCACRPALVEVSSTRDLGPLEQSSAIRGRDGGYSVLVQGRSAWLYGDTVLAFAAEDGSTWRDNTWSWTLDLDARDGVSGFSEPLDAAGAPRELFPETAEEAVYNAAHSKAITGGACALPCGAREVLWPKAAVAAPGQALVFYMKIHGEPGAWNFVSRGVGIATWSELEKGPTRSTPSVIDGEPTLLFGPDEPGFGDAAALGPDGYVYAWGRDDDTGAKEEILGRAKPDEVNVRSAWRFWTGGGWSERLTEANPVFDGASQMGIFRDESLDTWLALYLDEPSNRIVLRTAPAPEGPWSRELEVALALEPPDGWPYCGLVHPEYAHDGTELLTYYRSNGDGTGEIRAVEISLGRK
jgi:hypothetical protein